MLLLDSQTAIWAMSDSPRLGAAAKQLITDTASAHISVASVWELTIKSMLGKLKIPVDFAAQAAAQGFEPLDISADDAEGLREFPELSRHDPFDRLIVSQAYQHRLTLLTADGVLLGLGRDFIVDSRK
ncbi:type II toxin-antitoxin system VapC family toxin [Glycomyces buryatensis]|uniref:Type II toxin-antitoxin system VapC family toxin n=1 Tax=Glycomyces buryatensis TaxID=2570927 RepID=A0A4S8QJ94_9ACTN|nr:type II toxin-antitoxin system VapC family toxin [Glycomyces buryatensis]THV43332.1 type II toxin-antitoxin system VapC family toxin [Glycomyces buryatensis]